MSEVERLVTMVAQRLGVRGPVRASDVELLERIEQRRRALGVATVEQYVDRVMRAPDDELPHLASAFTNGWTWLFRDPQGLEALAEALRARVVGRPARVWVAGCATGEEAYGVVIACVDRGVDVRVLATDVDAERLEVARAGVYEPSSLRRVTADVLDRHFEQLAGGRARAKQALRDRIEVRLHNVLSPPPVPDGGVWDAVVCRNVLLHLSDEAAARARTQLAAAHANVLLFGPADVERTSRVSRTDPTPRPFALQRASTPPRPRPAPRLPTATELWRSAVAALASGAHHEAHAMLTSLLRTTPDYVPAILTIGNLRAQAHQFELAADAYRLAEQLVPTSSEVHFLWGALHRKRGQWQDAAAALRRALFFDPELWPARFLLAGVWERLGEATRGRLALEETLRSLERRPLIDWMSCVEPIESIACPPEAVRWMCTRRLAAGRADMSKGA